MVIQETLSENQRVIDKLEKLLLSLEIEHKNMDHYILAFIHRSFVNEKSDIAKEHNERLEFLGDAVLELVVTSRLFHEFPEKTEGELTDIRSSLVRGRNLSMVAKELKFEEYLLLGKGEDLSGGRQNEYILANTVESFIGAIYLDVGYEVAEKFIMTHVYSSLGDILENNLFKDPKSLLQEFSQAEFGITPGYEVLSEIGPDHDKVFKVGVYLGTDKIGEGEGSSKKKAQESAAGNAILTKDEWSVNFSKKK